MNPGPTATSSPAENAWTLQGAFSRFTAHYGMVFVLALLCAYFAAVTNTEQPLRGAEAARQVAARIRGGAATSVLLVARAVEEDAAFLEALERGLRGRGLTALVRAQGEPRDARVALEQLAAVGRPLDYIATTPECANWTVLQNLRERFPVLGSPPILLAESHRWPTFLTRQNLLNVANQIAVVAILAAGMSVVILTGGIDLSVGSLIALSAVLVSRLLRDEAGGVAASAAAQVWCSLAGVTVCGAVGLFSGAMVAGFKVPPFIATLAVMQVASGLAFIVARGESIYELPEGFTFLGRGVGLLGLPHAVVLMLALYVGAHVVMTRTVLGRRIYAVGGNSEAARLSGVNVAGVLLVAYTFCGAMAGLGGVLQASQLKSGAPNYGVMYELYAIAAVVVGGTSLRGGEGRIFGTLIGALIIAVIQNGMNLTGVESYRQKVVLGLVILGAVLLDLLKRRDWRAVWRRWAGRRARAASPADS
jgi:ribose transport system permease protein